MSGCVPEVIPAGCHMISKGIVCTGIVCTDNMYTGCSAVRAAVCMI